MSPKNYTSREDIDWKLREDRAYLAEMLERRQELASKIETDLAELEDLDRRIEQTESSVAKWFNRKPG